MLATLRL